MFVFKTPFFEYRDNKSRFKSSTQSFDFDTLNDQAVTIRERDSMKQERIGIDQVEAWLAPRLLGC